MSTYVCLCICVYVGCRSPRFIIVRFNCIMCVSVPLVILTVSSHRPPLNDSVELNATLSPIHTIQLNGSVSTCLCVCIFCDCMYVWVFYDCMYVFVFYDCMYVFVFYDCMYVYIFYDCMYVCRFILSIIYLLFLNQFHCALSIVAYY